MANETRPRRESSGPSRIRKTNRVVWSPGAGRTGGRPARRCRGIPARPILPPAPVERAA